MVPKFSGSATEVTLQKLWANSAGIRYEGALTKIILDTHHGRSFAFSVTSSREICFGGNFGRSHVYLQRRDRILCVLSASLPQNSNSQPKNEYRERPCRERTSMIQTRGVKALVPWCRCREQIYMWAFRREARHQIRTFGIHSSYTKLNKQPPPLVLVVGRVP